MWCPLTLWNLHLLPSLGPNYTSLRIGRSKDLMQVKNLVTYLFTASVQGCEVLCRFSYSFKRRLAFYRRCIITLSLWVWTLGVWNTLILITRLLFSISLHALYITFCSGDHFCQQKCWLMEERLLEVSCLELTLEYPHKHLLVWWDDPNSGFIKPYKVVPRWLWWTLSYVE